METEPIMPIIDRDFRVLDSDDPIIPVVRDRAPVIERIRDRRQSGDDVSNELGELIGSIVKSDSRVDKQQARDDLVDGMQESAADELGIEVGDLDPFKFEQFADDITSLNETDVLVQSALDELNIQDVSNERGTGDTRGVQGEGSGEVAHGEVSDRGGRGADNESSRVGERGDTEVGREEGGEQTGSNGGETEDTEEAGGETGGSTETDLFEEDE
jgi:hypothetical protein